MRNPWQPGLQGGWLAGGSGNPQAPQAAADGDIVWMPGEARRQVCALARFIEDVERRTGRSFHGRYDELWLWSVQHIEEFWASVWTHFELPADERCQCVLESRAMPGARWFPGARLNLAEQALYAGPDDEVALVHLSELQPAQPVIRAALRCDTRRVATGLRQLGVGVGDRVAACLPNGHEAAVAFLATAAIGAVWVAVPPGLDPQAMAERLVPLQPKVLLATGAHLHGGALVDLRPAVLGLLHRLPGLRRLVWVNSLGAAGPRPLADALPWAALLGTEDPGERHFSFEPMDSGQALWVWFSAGTSGPCKPLLHSHTGVLLEALVVLALHHDLRAGKRLFAPAEVGDLLWHLSVAALVTGASLVLRDGHATYPRTDLLWKVAADLQATHFAVTPAYLGRMRKAGLRPRESCELDHLQSVILTGAPASAELFSWLHRHVASDLWVAAACHCADIAGAFLAPCPLLPVRAGRLQCRTLGHDVQAWAGGEPVVGSPGELVCVQPLPSMPLGVWGDTGHRRVRATWFDEVPGVWHQGDLLRLDPGSGGCILGRCTCVLVHEGHSLGTKAYYDALDGVAGLDDLLVVCCEREAGGRFIALFIKLAVGAVLDDTMVQQIRQRLRLHGLERFLPDTCQAIPEVPTTQSGDRMELPVRRLLAGWAPEQAACGAALARPEALAWCRPMARSLAALPLDEARP